jgi:hypothetical protein
MYDQGLLIAHAVYCGMQSNRIKSPEYAFAKSKDMSVSSISLFTDLPKSYGIE